MTYRRKRINYIAKKRIEKGITQVEYAKLTSQCQSSVSTKEALDISKLQFKDIVLAVDVLDLDINELIDICKEEISGE